MIVKLDREVVIATRAISPVPHSRRCCHSVALCSDTLNRNRYALVEIDDRTNKSEAEYLNGSGLFIGCLVCSIRHIPK